MSVQTPAGLMQHGFRQLASPPASIASYASAVETTIETDKAKKRRSRSSEEYDSAGLSEKMSGRKREAESEERPQGVLVAAPVAMAMAAPVTVAPSGSAAKAKSVPYVPPAVADLAADESDILDQYASPIKP